MPIYDYVCAACGRRFEVVHGVHDEGPTSCPLCGKGPVRKAISAAAVHYKGSGWAKKERRATVTAATSKGADADPGGDAAKADASDSGDGKGSAKPASSASTEKKSEEHGPSRSADARPSKSAASKPTD